MAQRSASPLLPLLLLAALSTQPGVTACCDRLQLSSLRGAGGAGAAGARKPLAPRNLSRVPGLCSCPLDDDSVRSPASAHVDVANASAAQTAGPRPPPPRPESFLWRLWQRIVAWLRAWFVRPAHPREEDLDADAHITLLNSSAAYAVERTTDPPRFTKRLRLCACDDEPHAMPLWREQPAPLDDSTSAIANSPAANTGRVFLLHYEPQRQAWEFAYAEPQQGLTAESESDAPRAHEWATAAEFLRLDAPLLWAAPFAGGNETSCPEEVVGWRAGEDKATAPHIGCGSDEEFEGGGEGLDDPSSSYNLQLGLEVDDEQQAPFEGDPSPASSERRELQTACSNTCRYARDSVRWTLRQSMNHTPPPSLTTYGCPLLVTAARRIVTTAGPAPSTPFAAVAPTALTAA